VAVTLIGAVLVFSVSSGAKQRLVEFVLGDRSWA
jgi:hypothetical protein